MVQKSDGGRSAPDFVRPDVDRMKGATTSCPGTISCLRAQRQPMSIVVLFLDLDRTTASSTYYGKIKKRQEKDAHA